MRKRFKLPSPAMTVACISLAVALSGASYAAITLPKNSVGTKQIRNNAVKSNKIAANAVKGVDVDEATLGSVPSAANAANAAAIADNTVNSAKVVDNSLGGADINESALGNVTSASSAGNADTVDQIHATQFGFTAAPSTGNTQVLSFGGLVLTAACDIVGDLSLTATTTANNALLRVSTNAATSGDNDFDTIDSVDMLPAGDDGVQGMFTYSRPFVSLLLQGATVTGTFTAEEDAFGANNCVVRGTAMAYTPGISIIIPPIILP